MMLSVPKSAAASMASVVALITRGQCTGLLKPFLKGASGLMSMKPMAHFSPYFLSVGYSDAGHSSTLGTPSSFATWQSFSTDHWSPVLVKHHSTIDCLIRPLVTAGPFGSLGYGAR